MDIRPGNLEGFHFTGFITQVDRFPFLDPQFVHIPVIHVQHLPVGLSSVDILLVENHGIELSFAANRGQQEIMPAGFLRAGPLAGN